MSVVASFPELTMRSGSISTVNPMQVRNAVSERHVLSRVRQSVGRPYPGMRQTPAAMPAPATAVVPPTAKGVLLGADDKGREVRAFPGEGNPTHKQAEGVMKALRRAAEVIRSTNVAAATPALVGGPLAALAAGNAVVLRWPNGVAISTAL